MKHRKTHPLAKWGVSLCCFAYALTVGCADTTPPVAGLSGDPPAAAEPSKKRSEPAQVKPVVFDGVRYEQLRHAKGRGLGQNSGYVAAYEATTDRELWVLKVYDVTYRADVETDKQEVYFISLTLDKRQNRLVIENERKERFTVELANRSVTRVK